MSSELDLRALVVRAERYLASGRLASADADDATSAFTEALRIAPGDPSVVSLVDGVESAVAALPGDEGLSSALSRVRGALSVARGELVHVSAGPFWMGCNTSVDSECDRDEKPYRQVSLGEFWIDRTEVTVDAYRRCVEAGECSAGATMPFLGGKQQSERASYCNWGKSDRGSHPMNCLDWSQAVAYCSWSGKRLPTEAEWEKAARGSDGRKYPWGNGGYGSSGQVANIADESAKRQNLTWITESGYDDGWVGTSPVGTFPSGASPYGALDMIGNVREWTSDRHGSGQARVVRGGSWGGALRDARASNRDGYEPASRYVYIGFRCAR